MEENTSEGRLTEFGSHQKRALLVGTYPAGEKKKCEEHLDELESLATTFGLTTALKLSAPLREIHAATFLGKGKVEEIGQLVLEHLCDVVIFDDEIAPHQQRNLEKTLKCTVIDRTELILGVFAQRAQTKEARLQVELASCRYQLPRLRRLWTHLSRQRSGGASGGAVKGEGEKQIEIDKRILKREVDKLQKELEEVKKHRHTQRRARERKAIPTFAIIGYTNIGKSTLLKALTDADVLVEDKLFATLDTTTRKFTLPNKQNILLVDTVGFIRKIPHPLVAAFKGTLEEAVEADILLHLIDVSHPAADDQAKATYEVLKELGALGRPIITLLNKTDQCLTRLMIDRVRFKYPKTVEISALNKTGFERLMDLMVREISLLRKRVNLRVPQKDYALVSEILREGRILTCEYEENDILLEVEIPEDLEPKINPFVLHDSETLTPRGAP